MNGCLSILSIYGADHFVLKLGDEKFSKTNIFFSASLSVKTFFFRWHLPADNFFMPAKNLFGLFLLLQTRFSGFPPPPPLNLYDLPMVYNALIFQQESMNSNPK